MDILKKPRIYLAGLVLLLLSLVWLAVNFISEAKPTVNDYRNFLETRYDIECEDEQCTTFFYTVTENAVEKEVLMLAHSGRTSERTFTNSIETNYFSEPGSKYFLSIELEGFLGKINVIEEASNFLDFNSRQAE